MARNTMLAGGQVVPGSGQGDPLLWHGVPASYAAAVPNVWTLHSTATGGTVSVSIKGAVVDATFDAHLGTAADLQAAADAALGAGVVTIGGGPFGTADITVTSPTGPVAVSVDPALATGGTVTATNTTAGSAVVPGAYANRAAKGALLQDLDGGNLYQNRGTQTQPTWTQVAVP